MEITEIEVIPIGDHALPSPHCEQESILGSTLNFRAYQWYFPDQDVPLIRDTITGWRPIDYHGVSILPRHRVVINTGFSIIHPLECDYRNMLTAPLLTTTILSSMLGDNTTARERCVLVELTNNNANKVTLHYGHVIAMAQMSKRTRIQLKKSD
jgi:hypothetical protein